MEWCKGQHNSNIGSSVGISVVSNIGSSHGLL